MLREFEDGDARRWRPSPAAQYLIGGVSALFLLALAIGIVGWALG